LYPGGISDPEIFRKSGGVDLIKPGDQIMVDKGFLIDEDVITRGGVVIRPAFKNALLVGQMLKMYRTHLFGVVPVIQQLHKILHIVFLIFCPKVSISKMLPLQQTSKIVLSPPRIQTTRTKN
jgi:hypothetical protein